MSENKQRLRAEAFAAARGLILLEPLGSSVNGNVWKVINKEKPWAWAVKLHHHRKFYEHERECYKRLSECGVFEVHNGNVPQLIGYDHEWMAIEMSIVDGPYILGFSRAYLDLPQDFSAEVLEECELRCQEHYGDAWLRIKAIRSKFE